MITPMGSCCPSKEDKPGPTMVESWCDGLPLRDVHTYDHRLEKMVEGVKEYLEDFPMVEPLNIQHLLDLVKDHPVALSTLQILMTKNDPGNTDQVNHVTTFEILKILNDHHHQLERDVFIEQLVDMRAGFCPQGRTTRLLQMLYFISPIEDDNESIEEEIKELGLEDHKLDEHEV